MAEKKLKVWLSATSISDIDLGQIVSVLPNYEIVFNRAVLAKQGAMFDLDIYLSELKNCDLFLGIINPKMTISNGGDMNLPLKEIERAIELQIPYWFTVHRDVTFTRNLLNDLVSKSGDIQSNKYVFDVRTVDIYNEIKSSSFDRSNHNGLTSFFRLSAFSDEISSAFFEVRKRKKNEKLMVASTVYGFEDQLSLLISNLQSDRLNIINSYHGTLRVNPKLSNLDNCINSVNNADLFIGIIRPYYGTGNIKDKDAVNREDKNITFEEIRKAIALEKPRWFYVHRDVEFASKILNYIKVNVTFEGKQANLDQKNTLNDNDFVDMQSIDLYNFVIKDHETNLALRNGNWAQEFYVMIEAIRYFQTQLGEITFIEELLNR
jgi:hypothetical protein